MSNLKWLKSTLKGATQLVKCEESRARLFDMGISEVTVTFVLSFPTVTRSPRTPEYIKNHFSALHAVPELSSHVTHQWHTTTCCSSPFFDCYVHSNVTVHQGRGSSGCTCLVVHLDLVCEKLLKLANLHDLVLHWLGTVDDEGGGLLLALEGRCSWLLSHCHCSLHGAGIMSSALRTEADCSACVVKAAQDTIAPDVLDSAATRVWPDQHIDLQLYT